MTDLLSRKLARIQNYATRYEIVMTHPDGRKYLVCYGQKSRRAILRAVADKNRVHAIVAIAGTDQLKDAGKSADGFLLGGWTIKASGRTQRDAYIEGELEYVDP